MEGDDRKRDRGLSVVLFLFPAIEPYIEHLPPWLAALVTVGILTPVSMLIMVPAVTWALKRWLYKQAS